MIRNCTRRVRPNSGKRSPHTGAVAGKTCNGNVNRCSAVGSRSTTSRMNSADSKKTWIASGAKSLSNS